MKLQQNIGRKANNAFPKKANKIALSVSDDKRIQTCAGVISYSYVIGTGRVFKAELIEYVRMVY